MPPTPHECHPCSSFQLTGYLPVRSRRAAVPAVGVWLVCDPMAVLTVAWPLGGPPCPWCLSLGVRTHCSLHALFHTLLHGVQSRSVVSFIYLVRTSVCPSLGGGVGSHLKFRVTPPFASVGGEDTDLDRPQCDFPVVGPPTQKAWVPVPKPRQPAPAQPCGTCLPSLPYFLPAPAGQLAFFKVSMPLSCGLSSSVMPPQSVFT